MDPKARKARAFAWAALAVLAMVSVIVFAGRALGIAQSQTDFPDGYDAVAAAPASHRVVFENALVRVLEVTLPAAGKIEPMHHHHWPSFFLEWDTGGKSPHTRYHQPGDKVRDVPSEDAPSHPGRWVVHWMKPEPMHAIETVEDFSSPNDPAPIRVEIKAHP